MSEATPRPARARSGRGPNDEGELIEHDHAAIPDRGTTMGGDEVDEISLVDVAEVLLRQRWSIVGLTVLLTIMAGTWTLVRGRSWTATTSFMPQTSTGAGSSRLAALAGEFGIDVGGGEPGATPDFYAELVRSREILGEVAADTFHVEHGAGVFSRGPAGRTLADLLGMDEPSPRRRRANVIRWLREHAVSTDVGQQTGIVKVSVTTPWAVISDSITGQLVELVNEFNLRTRQSQASAERRFIEGRMDEAQKELRSAENALQRFLQNNRAFESSPELAFEEDRLQRVVNMRQQVYTSLAQSFEQARIAEVRNTAVITVVEPPEIPVRPDPRHLLLHLILGLMLGAMVGVGVAFVREYLRRAREGDSTEFEEVSALWQQAKGDLRRFTRLLRRNA